MCFIKYWCIEAITILKHENNNHRLLQIDLNMLAKDEELLEDVYDSIAIELRKNTESILWEEAKTTTTPRQRKIASDSYSDCLFSYFSFIFSILFILSPTPLSPPPAFSFPPVTALPHGLNKKTQAAYHHCLSQKTLYRFLYRLGRRLSSSRPSHKL